MKREAVIRILKQQNTEITSQFGVKSLSLFGSVVRGEATNASDIDLLVKFNRPPRPGENIQRELVCVA